MTPQIDTYGLTLWLAQRSRRIWLVDRQLHSIGSSHREDLGDWLTRRYAFAQKESVANKTVIRNTGFSTEDLSHEWGLQRKAQLSAQARKHSFIQYDQSSHRIASKTLRCV